MKKMIYLMIALIMLSCSTEAVDNIVTADAKANVQRGKPISKKQRGIYLEPTFNKGSRLAFDRIIAQPEIYTGDFNLSETIDFDNDGVNDEVTIGQRCYFPRTFSEILVNGEAVNYSLEYGAVILGYQDVDADGWTDIVFEGGKSIAYNNGETYSQYNVGYNRSGVAVPLKDIVQSLVITTADPNPEFIKWDLSEYGITNYTFHVYLFNKNLNDDYGYQQTTTYGEFGFYSLNRLVAGETYVLRFTNLGDDCSDIDVEFSI